MKEQHIAENMIFALLGPDGPFNILTVIPIEEIEGKGIMYVRSKINEGQYSRDFDAFWAYFKRTWLHGAINPKSWNIHHILTKEVEDQDFVLINRTNNPLERHNRALNDAFTVSHPNMIEFVTTIKRVSCEYLENLTLIQKCKMRRPMHKTATVHSIPEDYKNFHF
jgi:hypothetical protein